MQLHGENGTYLELAILGYAYPEIPQDDHLLCLVRVEEPGWDEMIGGDAIIADLLADEATAFAAWLELVATRTEESKPALFVFRQVGIQIEDLSYSPGSVYIQFAINCGAWRGIAPFRWNAHGSQPRRLLGYPSIILPHTELLTQAHTLREEAKPYPARAG